MFLRSSLRTAVISKSQTAPSFPPPPPAANRRGAAFENPDSPVGFTDPERCPLRAEDGVQRGVGPSAEPPARRRAPKRCAAGSAPQGRSALRSEFRSRGGGSGRGEGDAGPDAKILTETTNASLPGRRKLSPAPDPHHLGFVLHHVLGFSFLFSSPVALIKLALMTESPRARSRKGGTRQPGVSGPSRGGVPGPGSAAPPRHPPPRVSRPAGGKA